MDGNRGRGCENGQRADEVSFVHDPCLSNMVPMDISAVDKGLSPSPHDAGINRGKFLEIRYYLLEIALFF